MQFLMKCRNGQTVCQNGSHGFVKLNLITRINSNNDVLSSSETYHRMKDYFQGMMSVYEEQRRRPGEIKIKIYKYMYKNK